MITLAAIVAAGAIGAAIGRLSVKTNKNQNLVKQTTVEHPNSTKPKTIKTVTPALPPPLPKPKPTLPSISSKTDVKDIKTMYEYLCYRTDALDRLTEECNPVHELDSFIKENMIDLRDCPGLICSDGVSLLQYAVTQEDGHKFSLVRMKSPNMVAEYKYDVNGVRNRFDVQWWKITEDVIRRMGSRRMFEFHQQIYTRGDITESGPVSIDMLDFRERCDRSRKIPTCTGIDDPIASFREEQRHPFAYAFRDVVRYLLESFRQKFPDCFVYAVDEDDKTYMVTENGLFTEDLVFGGKYLEEYVKSVGISNFLYTHRNEIIAAKSHGIFSDVLNLTFVGFPKQ